MPLDPGSVAAAVVRLSRLLIQRAAADSPFRWAALCWRGVEALEGWLPYSFNQAARIRLRHPAAAALSKWGRWGGGRHACQNEWRDGLDLDRCGD